MSLPLVILVCLPSSLRHLMYLHKGADKRVTHMTTFFPLADVITEYLQSRRDLPYDAALQHQHFR